MSARFALVGPLLLVGCAQRAYTSERAALEARLNELKKAEVSARNPKLVEGTPPSLSPTLSLAGPRAASPGNALILPLEEVALLDQSDQELLRQGKPLTNGRSERAFPLWDLAGEGGLSCAAEATRVLGHADCGDEQCKAERSERCARWLLGLHYVVFIDTLVDTGRLHQGGTFSTVEEYKGRAVIVELATAKVADVVPFEGVAHNGADRVKFAQDVKGAFGPALHHLQERLQQRHGIGAPAGFAPFFAQQ